MSPHVELDALADARYIAEPKLDGQLTCPVTRAATVPLQHGAAGFSQMLAHARGLGDGAGNYLTHEFV